MKRLPILLFLVPSLGFCTLPDDHYYGNDLHRQPPLTRIVAPNLSPNFHQPTPVTRNEHGHAKVDPRPIKRNLRHNHKPIKNKPNIHQHGSNNLPSVQHVPMAKANNHLHGHD
jgi:hypothetical protein